MAPELRLDCKAKEIPLYKAQFLGVVSGKLGFS